MKRSLLFIISFLFVFGIAVRAVEAAPHLTVDPNTRNVSVNETFEVTLGVDSDGETIGGVDGVGTYDSGELELVSIVESNDMVFSDGGCSIDNNASAGNFSFSCYANDAFNDAAVVGDLVVITFKGIDEGTATLNYSCTNGSTVDSNIVQPSTVTDIINCSSNESGSYTIGEGSGETIADPDPTAVPTSSGSTGGSTGGTTGGSTGGSTGSTTLPQTGNFGVTVGIIAFAVVTLLSAVFLRFL